MCLLGSAQSDEAVKNRDSEFLRDALRNLTNGFNVVAKERLDIST